MTFTADTATRRFESEILERRDRAEILRRVEEYGDARVAADCWPTDKECESGRAEAIREAYLLYKDIERLLVESGV